MAKASDNLFPYLHLVPAAAPASPAAGSQRLYLDSADGNKLKRKDSSGTVTTVEGSGGGGIPAWSSYTPVWTATSGSTNVGSTGSLAGAYQQLDKTVFFKLTLVLAGSGISTGTGPWAFTLPVAHASVPSGISNHGIMLGGYYEDFGNRAYNSPGGRLASSTSTFEMTYNTNNTSFPSAANIIGATTPFTWGASDNLSVYGMYQAA